MIRSCWWGDFFCIDRKPLHLSSCGCNNRTGIMLPSMDVFLQEEELRSGSWSQRPPPPLYHFLLLLNVNKHNLIIQHIITFVHCTFFYGNKIRFNILFTLLQVIYKQYNNIIKLFFVTLNEYRIKISTIIIKVKICGFLSFSYLKTESLHATREITAR